MDAREEAAPASEDSEGGWVRMILAGPIALARWLDGDPTLTGAEARLVWLWWWCAAQALAMLAYVALGSPADFRALFG